VEVILVHRPVAITSMTSVNDKDKDYIVVYGFTFSKHTTCINLTTQQPTTPEEAIKGARYGRYECRVSKVDGNDVPLVVKERSPVFQKDNMPLIQATGVIGLAVAFLFAIGKS
jgi:hypothetical protein